MVVALTVSLLWVIRALTGPCACNKRGASEYQGGSEGKNIDGLHHFDARRGQHEAALLVYFIHALLPSQLEQASEKGSRRHWTQVPDEPERAATGPGAHIHLGSHTQFGLHCLSQWSSQFSEKLWVNLISEHKTYFDTMIKNISRD